MKRVVIPGGAGDMAAVAGQALLALRSDVQIVLADRNRAKAEHRAGQPGPATSRADGL